jgi:hypothetical protein
LIFSEFVVSQLPRLRSHVAALIALWALVATSGCSNRAHTDLYQQRMASEIRVLEDQLYDADYQNRVLQDKLQQVERKAANCEPAPKPTVNPTPVHPSPQAGTDSYAPTIAPTPVIPDMGDGLESELGLPIFDEGVPVSADELAGPPIDPVPLDDADTPNNDNTTERRLPAPGGPEPPSKADTTDPQVDEGMVLPPPKEGEIESDSPNQIVLPDSVQAAAGVPAGLRLNEALSGGTRVDGQLPGMTIVVNVVDKIGKVVDLEDFDVAAELSIVILDPEKEGDEARIGRWDFSSEEVAAMVESTPISGFHVPVSWDQQPSGEDVVVHVRLRAEDDEMRCDATLKAEKKAIIADWTPRGETLR